MRKIGAIALQILLEQYHQRCPNWNNADWKLWIVSSGILSEKASILDEKQD